MPDRIYCYHCRQYHPASEARLVMVQGRKRWRCLKTLRAVKTSPAERDAFGRSIRESNQARAGAHDRNRPLPRCVRELIYGPPLPKDAR